MTRVKNCLHCVLQETVEMNESWLLGNTITKKKINPSAADSCLGLIELIQVDIRREAGKPCWVYNQDNVYIFGLWDCGKKTRKNPQRLSENMQTPPKKGHKAGTQDLFWDDSAKHCTTMQPLSNKTTINLRPLMKFYGYDWSILRIATHLCINCQMNVWNVSTSWFHRTQRNSYCCWHRWQH